jgi:hypothetical protein
MSCPATIADLPTEFAAVDDVDKQAALDSACAMLPDELITLYLGEDTAKIAHWNGAAHLLTCAGLGDGSVDGGTTKSERVGDVSETKQVADASALGIWAGSCYGLVVAGILAQLPRRRRGRGYPLAVR